MSKTVLVVDDEDDARGIAVLALQMKTDWTLLQANSGTTALEMATEKTLDLILLDMMMPEMDGKLTLKHLKENSATQNIPVILVTAKVQPLDQADIDPNTVVAVFTKPFRPLTLADNIREQLGW